MRFRLNGFTHWAFCLIVATGTPLRAAPLYWTSFEGTVGSLPADWQVLAGGAGWRIDPTGEYRFDGTGQGLSHYTGTFSNGQAGNSFADGTIEATFRRSGSNVVGLAARLQDSGRYYHARLYGSNLELYRFGGTGATILLSSTPAPGYEPGQSWTISMTLLGTSISASLFDHLGSPVATVSATDSNFTSGTVGVRGQATSVWEDFLVAAPVTTYQWTGASDSTFNDPANWSDGTVAPTNNPASPFPHTRISVENGAGSPLVYTAGQGTTVYAPLGMANGALSIGEGGSGSMVLQGGTFDSRGDGPDALSGAGDGSLTIAGGHYINTHGGNSTFLVKRNGSGATGTLTVASGSFTTGAIQFGDSVAATGSGVVNLEGGTLITGILRKGHAGTSDVHATVNFDGSTLVAGASSTAFMQGLDAAYVKAGGAVIDTNGFNVTIAQDLLDGGGGAGLTKKGDGRLILSGTNTYTGATSVKAGVLRVTNAAALGSTAGGTTVATGAVLELAGGITVTGQSLTISSIGTAAAALQSVTGHNTWAAGITLGHDGTRLAANGSAQRLTISGVIGDDGEGYKLAIRNSGASSTGDRVILSGANTYGGDTEVVVGTLQIAGGDNRLPTTTVLRVGNSSNVSSATFDLNGRNQQVAGLTDQGSTMSRTVTNSSATPSTLTVNNSTNYTYAGVLSGDLALTKTGAGRLELSGENDYTGATSVDEGVLRISNPNALGTGKVTVADGARLDLAGGITVAGQSLTISSSSTGPAAVALQSVSGHNTWAGDVTLGRDGTRLAANGAGQSLTIAGVIGDGGEDYRLAIRNSGASSTGDRVILSGANTYGGDTEVVVGTLQIVGGDNRLPTTTVLRVGNSSNVSSATFDLNGWNQQVAGLTDDGSTMSRTVTNSSATSSVLTVNNSTSYTYAGVLSGDLALTKMGDGRLTLSGENTYTGQTSVSGGALNIGHANALGAPGEITVSSNARLALEGGVTVAGHSVTIHGHGGNSQGALQSASGENTWAGNVVIGSAGSRIGSYSGTLTVSGEISGDYGLIVRNNGSGRVTVLAGENTYTGATQVVGGTTKIGGDHNRLPIGTTLQLGLSWASAEFDLNGWNQEVAGLQITQTTGTHTNVVTNSSATPSVLTVKESGATVFSGAITGNLALTKTGAGTLILTGGNTHTGLTTVDAGTLLVTGSLANGGSSHVRVASAGMAFGASDPTIIRRVDLGGSFAGIGSQVTGLDTFATRADLRAGGNGGSGAVDVGMAWRAVSGADAAALPPLHDLVSDVLRLDGMDYGGNGQTDPFVLQMSYEPELLQPHQDGMFLAWLSSADGWINAVEGNIGIGGSAVANFQSASGGYAAGSWDAFVDAYNPTDLDSYLGSWGLDSTNQVAWAVLNHNSQFAVMAVPEPSAFLLSVLGVLWVTCVRRDRRRRRG